MADKLPPMTAQQYAEGQLKGEHGRWLGGSLHMTWEEFEERSDCFYARLRRMSPAEYSARQHEYAQLCMQYPKFARRYEAQREKNLRERNIKRMKGHNE